MIMGHTIQENGKILPKCFKNGEAQIYIIDVGMSSAYGTIGKAALELNHYRNGTTRSRAVYMDSVSGFVNKI